MKISMIAAMSKNRVIGRDNDLPWHLPDDFKFFKETTRGHHVLMGRKNFESLPHKFRPLPDRVNMILTRNEVLKIPGTLIFNSISEAIEHASGNNERELFIIGGGEIYQMALPFADKIYLTEIDAEIEGDTFFPDFEAAEWKETSRNHHNKDDRHNYSFDFVVYERVR
jgi:dihydrofolate reductase